MSLKPYMKSVASVLPRDTLIEASERMRARDIGCVIVLTDDGRPIGIVTDRDIVLRAIALGRDPALTTVEEVMTSPVATLPQGATLREATELMRRYGVRRVPIVDARGYVAGMLALDDVLLVLAMELGNLAAAVFNEITTEASAERI